MAKEKKNNRPDVQFINSVALACNDIDGNVRHFQISIVQEVDSKQFRVYFDVVDPSKIKLAEQ